MKAIILAAGMGTRLRPIIGEGKSKTMLEYAKQPLLLRTIDALRERNITEITMVVNYVKEQIMDFFGDGSKFGVKINYVVQPNAKGGTADALRYAKNDDEKFLVIYGDNIFDYRILDELMKVEKNFDGVLCCKSVRKPQMFGVLEVENNLVKRITEKSPNPPSNLALAGIFVLPNEIFSAIDETKISPRGEYELTDSIQILINRGRKIGYMRVNGYWLDPASKEDILRAQQLVK
jgi:dTDP-glucose pyrophosphorylase